MISTQRPVTLQAGSQTVRVPEERVYFPFASGRFGYDCVACGAKCCGGHGYELGLGAEMQAHLTRAPAVRFFFDRCEAETAKHYHVRNCAPGCFFLNEQHMCGVQVEFGYSSKPETCRLFPFNNFLLVGTHLVVAPHTNLCPLDVLPAGRSSGSSDHGALSADLSAATINLDVPTGEPVGGGAQELIELERRIVTLSEDCLENGDYLRFSAAQLAATRGAGTDSCSRANAYDEVSQFGRVMYDVLGSPAPTVTPNDPLVRTMIASTPALRAQMVFERRNATHRRFAVPLDRVPHVLLALFAFARFAREAGMANVTYQTIMRLCLDYQPLLILLAQVDRPLVWDARAVMDLSFPGDAAEKQRYGNIVRALLPRSQHRAPKTLGQILCEERSTSTAVEHAIFLKSVSRRLAGRLVPIERTRRTWGVRRIFAPRSAIQQWLVGNVNVEYFMNLKATSAGATRGGTRGVQP